MGNEQRGEDSSRGGIDIRAVGYATEKARLIVSQWLDAFAFGPTCVDIRPEARKGLEDRIATELWGLAPVTVADVLRSSEVERIAPCDACGASGDTLRAGPYAGALRRIACVDAGPCLARQAARNYARPHVVAALDPRKPAPRYHSFVNVILPGGGGLCCEWCGVAHNDTEDGAWGRLTEEQKARPIVSDVCPKAPRETPADRPTSRGGDDCEDGVERELERAGFAPPPSAIRSPHPDAGAVVPLGAYEALRREVDDLHLKLVESEARVRKLVGLVTDFANGARAAIRFVDSDGAP